LVALVVTYHFYVFALFDYHCDMDHESESHKLTNI